MQQAWQLWCLNLQICGKAQSLKMIQGELPNMSSVFSVSKSQRAANYYEVKAFHFGSDPSSSMRHKFHKQVTQTNCYLPVSAS
jgi:hypothetical protein